jgi:hypothetical protein
MGIEVWIAVVLGIVIVLLVATSATARSVALDSIRRPTTAIRVVADERGHATIVDDDDVASGRPGSGAPAA